MSTFVGEKLSPSLVDCHLFAMTFSAMKQSHEIETRQSANYEKRDAFT